MDFNRTIEVPIENKGKPGSAYIGFELLKENYKLIPTGHWRIKLLHPQIGTINFRMTYDYLVGKYAVSKGGHGIEPNIIYKIMDGIDILMDGIDHRILLTNRAAKSYMPSDN